jgi:hypothetical protein
MKRSAALTPLSHDHQHSLDAALWLRRADESTAAEAIARFRELFKREGRRHFEIEEELVLPALPADDPEWAPGVARVRDDHAAIRAAAGSVDDAAGARALGDRLHDHVRFEERTLLAIIERRLAPAELERLGAAIAQAEERAG